MNEHEYMIEAHALTKTFDGFKALDEMELRVPKGCVYGLVGPNGAGKTTLIRQLAGVSYPDSGDTMVDGQMVWENQQVKERIAHIPDDLFFFPSAYLDDMRKFYAGIYPNFDDGRFVKLKAAFPLDAKRRISKYSKGMQKQAALLLALCCRPDVLLLDEPVDGLDPIARRTVWSLIMQDVSERRTTVLVSSHNLRELEGVCDHVGIMRAGKIVLEKALADLQSNITKLQVAFPTADSGVGADIYTEAGAGAGADAETAFDSIVGFKILNYQKNGRILEYIVRGGSEEVLLAVNAMNPAPLLAEALPLTLEEVFIYELGGAGYAEVVI